MQYNHLFLAVSMTALGAFSLPACQTQGGGAGGSATGGSATGGSATGGAATGGSATGGSGGSGGGATSGVCPGVTPWPAGTRTCRTNADCDVDTTHEYCVAEPYTTCGSCMMVGNECASDADCGGLVCVTYVPAGPCLCSPGSHATRCVAPCATTGCEAGFACDPAGHCQPVACTDGFACGPGLTCNAGSALADAHGCAPTPCDAGFTCAEGSQCANGAPGADNHGCAPVHCTNGFTCPVNTVCGAGQANHGCSTKTCEVDTDCDCGVCLSGGCAPKLHICAVPPV